MCGFVTPLQGPEADAHRKPEVGETKGTAAPCLLPEPGPSLGSLPARGGRGGQKGTAWGVRSVLPLARSPLPVFPRLWSWKEITGSGASRW